LETELILDGKGGAKSVKFSEMTDDQLRIRCWVFPEAFAEYMRRKVAKRKNAPTSG
jgi:hypothetical protein